MSDLLQMSGITKQFPGVLALDRVSLHVRKGEVHALLGENGAGKSTLMKILSGAYTMDSGEIIFDGKKIAISSPKYAQEIGISIIYQELNLVGQMTVAENIFLSSLLQKNSVMINWKLIYQRAAELLKQLEVDIDVYAKVSTLGIAQQQMVEIAKALNHGCRSFTGWNLMLDETGGPNIGPFFCGGLVTLNSQTGELSYSGQYKALAHFSRFLQRGARVHASHIRADGMLMSTFPDVGMPMTSFAAENPDGSRVLVAVNPNDTKRQAYCRVDGQIWYIELLPDSVSTIVFK